MVEGPAEMSMVNIANLVVGTRALGPGLRSAVWFQGCPFHCQGCYSPAWIPDIPNRLMQVADLADELLSHTAIDGVTISGGDPFFQPQALFDLLVRLRSLQPGLSTIVFTGYRLEQLEQPKDGIEFQRFKTLIDVLIDGLYVEALNDGIGLRGSSNQRCHYFSGRHVSDGLENHVRVNEVQVQADHIQFVGIPSKALASIVLNDTFRKE